MSGFLTFAIGAGIGGAAVAYHKWAVQEAIRSERKESNRLRSALHEEIIRNAQTKAYSEGFDAGVSCPISDAERLARTFAARKGSVQIRTQKEA